MCFTQLGEAHTTLKYNVFKHQHNLQTKTGKSFVQTVAIDLHTLIPNLKATTL